MKWRCRLTVQFTSVGIVHRFRLVLHFAYPSRIFVALARGLSGNGEVSRCQGYARLPGDPASVSRMGAGRLSFGTWNSPKEFRIHLYHACRHEKLRLRRILNLLLKLLLGNSRAAIAARGTVVDDAG